MIVHNKLDKAFGPMGTTAGMVLFLAGIATTFYSLTGLFFIVVGAFVGFTSTSTEVDFDGKRIKFTNNLFGIVRMGKWISIQPEMKLGLIKSNRVSGGYSQSNRSLEVPIKDVRLLLYGGDGEKIMPIKKFKTIKEAQEELNEWEGRLGLSQV